MYILKEIIPLTLIMLFATGCDFFSSSSDTNSSESIQNISFLNGGNYGKASIKVIDANESNTTLQKLTLWANNTNSEKKFIPYGGIQSSFSDNYELYGNSFTKKPLQLKYTLKPGSGFQNGTYSFALKVYFYDNSTHYCVFQDETSGELKLSDSDWVCLAYPLFQDIALDNNHSNIKLSVDIGVPVKADNYVFYLNSVEKYYDPDTQVNFASMQELLPSYVPVSVSDENRSVLPPHTIAHGTFLPSPDGFGFTNWGDRNSELLSDSDIAKIYGAQTACFNDNEQNCSLNSYGYYLKNLATDQSGGQCYGFALAAMMLHNHIEFKGKSKPSDYNPKADSTITLTKSDVQNLIAFKFYNQENAEVAKYFESCRNMTPMDVVDSITQAFNTNDPMAVLGLWEYQNSQIVGGHAVTPYAISKESADSYRIYIYDNNYPADTNRFVEINSTTQHWKYEGYEGAGTINALFAIPLSMQQYYKIDPQSPNTTKFTNKSESKLFKMGIKNPQGELSGYNFDTKNEVNNITNATSIPGLDTVQPQYEIQNTDTATAFSLITSLNELNSFLANNYSITVNKIQSNTTIRTQSTLIKLFSSALSSAYSNAVVISQDFNGSKNGYDYTVHPSARLLTGSFISSSTIKLFMNDNINKKGYMYKVSTSEQNTSSTKMGALIADDGTLEIFVYNDNNVTQLDENVSYSVVEKIVDDNGQLVTSKALTISQEPNSALKFTPQQQQLLLKGKTLTNEFELNAQRVY